MHTPTDVLFEPGQRLHPPVPAPARRESLPAVADVVILGAGVIGLSVALEAARAGLRPVVLDRGEAGAGTTMSATGMLAAAAEHEPGGEALLPFALESQTMWPAFCAGLEAESGVDLDFRRSGILLAALAREETERLRARFEYLSVAGLDCAWLGGPDLRTLEGSLRPSATAAIHCPRDHQVDPRALVAALREALARRGVALMERCGDVTVEREAGAVAGVACAAGVCRAPRVVLATGAWTATGGLGPPGLRIPLRPVKGQALALRARDGSDALECIVWTEQVHLAPKRGGRLIVGATMEEAGFDAAVTAGGVYALLEGARRALPCVEEMEIEAIWTGFRPTSDDDAPIIGDLDGAGLLIAAGHHRNGVLLAPATARAMAEILTRGRAGEAAAALSIERFR